MKEEEITLKGKKIKIITKLPKEMIEDNNLKIELDNTIDLKELPKEIKENEK